MHRTRRFALWLIALVLVAGCSPVMQSQPPLPPPAPTLTPAPRVAATATGGAAGAAKPAAKASPVAAQKPAGAAKPAVTVSPAAASTKPGAQPSPAATDASRAAANAAASAAANIAAGPPAVVATSVAGLPAVGPTAAVRADARGATRAGAPSDTLGVAASAGSVAAANTSDTEATALCGPGAILSTRAAQFVGRAATVAIARVSASYQPSVSPQPTYLNDAPAPNHVFTAIISGADRGEFQPSPESWDGKGLCVTGPVELVAQRPHIVVTAPSQLRAAR